MLYLHRCDHRLTVPCHAPCHTPCHTPCHNRLPFRVFSAAGVALCVSCHRSIAAVGPSSVDARGTSRWLSAKPQTYVAIRHFEWFSTWTTDTSRPRSTSPPLGGGGGGGLFASTVTKVPFRSLAETLTSATSVLSSFESAIFRFLASSPLTACLWRLGRPRVTAETTGW